MLILIFLASSRCGESVIVAVTELVTEFAGTYIYQDEYNDGPHYSQENGNGHIYLSEPGQNGKGYWLISGSFGSPYSWFYSLKSDCPSNTPIWYGWDGWQYSKFKTFTVSIDNGF